MKVKIKHVDRLLDDFFKVDRASIQFQKFDGTMSQEIVRLNLDRGDSVAAVIFNPQKQTVLLIKQFRYSIFTKDKKHAWSWEIVAGVIEEGQSPADAIAREILEEVGYQVHQLQLLFSFFPTPGGSNELIYLFYAEVSAQDHIQKGGGLIHEGENIQVLELPLKKALKMLESGEIVDAKTIIALQWLKAKTALPIS